MRLANKYHLNLTLFKLFKMISKITCVVDFGVGSVSQPGLQYPQCPFPPTCSLVFLFTLVEHQNSPSGSYIVQIYYSSFHIESSYL